jgi:hypothetical protein
MTPSSGNIIGNAHEQEMSDEEALYQSEKKVEEGMIGSVRKRQANVLAKQLALQRISSPRKGGD